MNETIRKLELEELKGVNGGQIYFTIAEDGPCWKVPWQDVGLVCTYHNEEAAKNRAKKLGLSTTIKYCWTPEIAQELAELAGFGHKMTQILSSKGAK